MRWCVEVRETELLGGKLDRLAANAHRRMSDGSQPLFRLRYAYALCIKRLWQCGHGRRRSTIGSEPYLGTPRRDRTAVGCVR